MPEFVKISELAALAGVQKATVAYYVREGLLPPPAQKPHRNVAYYDANLADRIRLIKELQSKRFMPLSVIKKILADKKGVAEIRAFIDSQAPGVALANEPMRLDELSQASGLSVKELEDLEHLGFIRSKGKGRHRRYSPADVGIAKAVGLMRKAGLSEEVGFKIEDLRIYQQAMQNLIRAEVMLFTDQVMGKLPRQAVLDLARAGLEGTNALLIALRQKLFVELLEEPVKQPPRQGRQRRRA